MAKRPLPPYNYTRFDQPDQASPELGADQMPPFVYKGVTSRVFPVRANMRRLHNFVDDYLNLDEFSGDNVFRPYVPFVYVMALDYGHMSPDNVNLGWVAQKEFTFTIPLEWYVRDDCGRLQFHDWAVVSPFIFVDHSWSLATGREVYGWPKVLARLAETVPAWTEDPRARELRLRMETRLFPRVYQGQRQVYRSLLEVEYDPAPSLFQAPVDFLRSMSILGHPLRAVQAGINLGSALAQTALGLPLFGHGVHRPRALAQKARRLRSTLHPANVLSNHQITLKQFADCEIPNRACYLGLVDSSIRVRRLNGAGLLGDPYIRRLDPTGGYRLRIHTYDSQPIVDTLGLTVDECVEVEGQQASILRPLAPFWLDMDMDHGAGTVLEEITKEVATAPRSRATPLAVPADSTVIGGAALNTSRCAAGQELTGPFVFPDTTVRALPLLATYERLKDFCRDYLSNDVHTFEPAGSTVFLVTTSHRDVASETNNLGIWAHREVEFLLPVYWYTGEPGPDTVRTMALVPVYAFVNSSTAAITGREVNGRPSEYARIKALGDPWLASAGPRRNRRYMEVETGVFPALHQGQGSESRRLVRVLGGPCPRDEEDDAYERWEAARDAAEARAATSLLVNTDNLFNMLGMSKYVVLGPEAAPPAGPPERPRAGRGEIAVPALPEAPDAAAEGNGNGEDEPPDERTSFLFITLKQFRDAADANYACFQSIVSYTRTIERLYEAECLPHEDLHVSLDRYDSMPIRSVLGLVPMHERVAPGVMRDFFAVQPGAIWFRARIRQSLGLDQLICGPDAASWQEDERLRATRRFVERFPKPADPRGEKWSAPRFGDPEYDEMQRVDDQPDQPETYRRAARAPRAELLRQLGPLPADFNRNLAREALVHVSPQTILRALREFVRSRPPLEPVAEAEGGEPAPCDCADDQACPPLYEATPDPRQTITELPEADEVWGWAQPPGRCLPASAVPAAARATLDKHHFRYETSDGDWYTDTPPPDSIPDDAADEDLPGLILVNWSTLTDEARGRIHEQRARRAEEERRAAEEVRRAAEEDRRKAAAKRAAEEAAAARKAAEEHEKQLAERVAARRAAAKKAAAKKAAAKKAAAAKAGAKKRAKKKAAKRKTKKKAKKKAPAKKKGKGGSGPSKS